MRIVKEVVVVRSLAAMVFAALFWTGTPKPGKAFTILAKWHADADYYYLESNGIPTHKMMVGITAWQQQVPLPQDFTGPNAFRIPKRPVFSDHPVSAKESLFSGAIAVAINGVPIFNPIKNDGRTDTYLAGELDDYGGHCGRADDYHYHTAPLHLVDVVGVANPIGYALDGFALYGTLELDGSPVAGLDKFNGHSYKDSQYHYHATKGYPYVNGGMRGVVEIRNDAITPQPRTTPVRPAGEPLRGAKIVGFTWPGPNRYSLEYTLRGQHYFVNYAIDSDSPDSHSPDSQRYKFDFVDPSGRITTEVHQKRPDGERPTIGGGGAGGGRGPGGRGGGRGPGRGPGRGGPPVVLPEKSPWTLKQLPDTGQNTRYADGDDSATSIHPPAFTKNGDGTVTDQVTGLHWQQGDGGEMTWDSAVSYCRALPLAGKSDWRLPYSQELFSILNHGAIRPALDTKVFDRTEAEYWWAIEERADNNQMAWVANAGGGIGAHPKNETRSAGGDKAFHARCVRGGVSNSASPRYLDNHDGTVTDKLTGLTWQTDEGSASATWTEALAYAKGLRLGGHADWRLPNIKELRSLHSDYRLRPTIDTAAFPGAPSALYWSSTTQIGRGGETAWTLDFAAGVVSYNEKGERLHVRAVR